VAPAGEGTRPPRRRVSVCGVCGAAERQGRGGARELWCGHGAHCAVCNGGMALGDRQGPWFLGRFATSVVWSPQVGCGLSFRRVWLSSRARAHSRTQRVQKPSQLQPTWAARHAIAEEASWPPACRHCGRFPALPLVAGVEPETMSQWRGGKRRTRLS